MSNSKVKFRDRKQYSDGEKHVYVVGLRIEWFIQIHVAFTGPQILRLRSPNSNTLINEEIYE